MWWLYRVGLVRFKIVGMCQKVPRDVFFQMTGQKTDTGFKDRVAIKHLICWTYNAKFILKLNQIKGMDWIACHALIGVIGIFCDIALYIVMWLMRHREPWILNTGRCNKAYRIDTQDGIFNKQDTLLGNPRAWCYNPSLSSFSVLL